MPGTSQEHLQDRRFHVAKRGVTAAATSTVRNKHTSHSLFPKKNMRLHFVHNKPEVWKSLANETSSKGREKGWSCHAYVRCLPMFTMSHDEAIYIPIHNLPILEDLKDIVRPYETQSLSTEISRDELNVGHSFGYGANPGPPVPGE